MSGISVATIDDPEFINLQPLDVNPLMSKCEIKVLYTGENRNGSYITKDVATEMAKTLRGAPIVGWYREEAQDFADHGDRITIDADGIKFESLTKPYGFVAPDAEVWFQKFEDTDEFGNTTEHEYLMTTGYLWTGQYEEAAAALEGNGRPQSMELDEDTLDGHWAEDSKKGMQFFIINDAIFSKLCILGEDVEPCFEGANISQPQISSSFTLDDKFKQTLYEMMQELQFALRQEGGQQMENNNEPVLDETQAAPETTDFTEVQEELEEHQDKVVESTVDENQDFTEQEETSDVNDVQTVQPNQSVEEYEALKTQYEELQDKYEDLQKELQSLTDFKNQVERDQKLSLIQSFYMLSDEDKKDVMDNIDKYSLDDIEAKLSVICVRKRVDFNSNKPEEKIEEPIPAVTYNLNDNGDDEVPAWISAVMNTKNKHN